MSETIEYMIIKKIKKARRGTLFFGDVFTSIGSPETIRRTLNRLVESGELDRVAPGIFVRPQIDSIIGKITPTIEDITKKEIRQGLFRQAFTP